MLYRLCFVLSFLMVSLPAHAAPKVVASIKPIHSLLLNIMKGVGAPTLLLKGSESPHTFALKPQDARNLHNADLIFWIGPELENFLKKTLKNHQETTQVISLLKAPGLTLHPFHLTKELGHDHSACPHHHHGPLDAHIWLDPQNAILIAQEMTRVLKEKDPKNHATYETNFQKLRAKLKKLDEDLAHSFQKNPKKSYMVFHDAYQYFEKRYSLKNAGVIALHPDHPLSAHRFQKVRNYLREKKIECLFKEPGFPQSLVDSLTKDLSLHIGLLDPEGTLLEAGEEMYFTLLKNLETGFMTCFKKP